MQTKKQKRMMRIVGIITISVVVMGMILPYITMGVKS